MKKDCKSAQRSERYQTNRLEKPIFDRSSPDYNPEALVPPHIACKAIGVAEGTLSVWRSTKRYDLKYVKSGRRVNYKIKHLLEFIESRTCK